MSVDELIYPGSGDKHNLEIPVCIARYCEGYRSMDTGGDAGKMEVSLLLFTAYACHRCHLVMIIS